MASGENFLEISFKAKKLAASLEKSINKRVVDSALDHAY